MQYTENMKLRKPEESDLFDIADFNFNADKMDDFRAQYASQMSQLSSELSRFGGLRFKTLTKSEYESLEPDPATVYYVTDGNKVTQYFGAVKLTSGTNTAGDSVTLSDGTAAAVAGAPQSLEEE